MNPADLFIRANSRSPTMPSVAEVEGAAITMKSARGQDLMQPRWSDDLVTITMGSAAAAYADNMQPAALCLPRAGGAEMSHSNYQQGLTLQLVCEQRQPFTSRLRVHQGGNTIV